MLVVVTGRRLPRSVTAPSPVRMADLVAQPAGFVMTVFSQIALGIKPGDTQAPAVIALAGVLVGRIDRRTQLIQAGLMPLHGIGPYRVVGGAGQLAAAVVVVFGQKAFTVEPAQQQPVAVVKLADMARLIILRHRRQRKLGRSGQRRQGGGIQHTRIGSDADHPAGGIMLPAGHRAPGIDLQLQSAGGVELPPLGLVATGPGQRTHLVQRNVVPRQLFGHHRSRVTQGADAAAGRIVTVFGQRAGRVDVGHLASGCVIQQVAVLAEWVGLSPQAPGPVVVVAGFAKDDPILPQDLRQSPTERIPGLYPGQPVRQRQRAVGSGVDGDILIAERVATAGLPPQAVVLVMGFAAAGIDMQQQQAPGIVDEALYLLPAVVEAKPGGIEPGVIDLS